MPRFDHHVRFCARSQTSVGHGEGEGGGQGRAVQHSDAGSRLAGTSATAHAFSDALVSIHGRKCVIRPS